jgi:hypothetical protein
MRRKSEVYSWRVAPALKASLEDAARGGRRSLADLLNEITARYLDAQGGRDEDAGEQSRLQARARRFAGRLRGTDPRRSTRVRSLVRGRLRRPRRAR